jgi:hypothetical protein
MLDRILNKNKAHHIWRFFRSGGFDQVRLETADDLRHLSELDPKLWTVLNCPTTGLEFDARTAALLDADGDGRHDSASVHGQVVGRCTRGG